MRYFRLQVTMLLMVAMMGISVISVAAHVTYQILKEMDEATPQPNVVYRYHLKAQDNSIKPDQTTPTLGQSTQPPQIDDSVPWWMVSVIGIYLTLIVVCSALIAVVVTNMIIRPLSMLSKAIDSIDPRDVLPMIGDEVNFENRETVRLINTLAEKVKSAMESRMRLVAAAGHDMRTPMTRMRLRAEFIEDDAQRESWIKDIDELTNIANSAITLVKEETSAEEMKDIRLDLLIHETVEDLLIINHEITDDCPTPVTVRGRSLALKRALTNLLVNAATYGKSAHIVLSSNGNEARITITDIGPGIPDDIISRAFEPFFRANLARQKNSTGAGLGLAIVKDIITSHKGTITLKNRPEGGLSQEIVIPTGKET